MTIGLYRPFNHALIIMLKHLFFIGFCLLGFSAHAEIKKWQDEKGRWHFSDNVPAQNQIGKHTPKVISSTKTNAGVAEKSKLILKDVPHGHYYHYTGQSPGTPLKIVVINHGMFGSQKTEFIAAQQMLEPWFKYADQHGVTLVAPVFDNAAFAVTEKNSGDGGYRGLFGRDINADDFLHEIIADYQISDKNYDGRFYLVGHSAGAQFANRYMVRHPERVIAAAYSAPAWLTFPDPNIKWPLGMARRKYTQTWIGRTQNKKIDIQPEITWWIKAAQIPTAVVVGATDLAPIRHEDNIGGDNHVERAKFWVLSMNNFANTHGTKSKQQAASSKQQAASSKQQAASSKQQAASSKQQAASSKQQVIIVPNVGHDYKKLAPRLQNFILPFL